VLVSASRHGGPFAAALERTTTQSRFEHAAVDSRAIVEALTKIYDAREIVREITRR
jgi:hypothetical protein